MAKKDGGFIIPKAEGESTLQYEVSHVVCLYKQADKCNTIKQES